MNTLVLVCSLLLVSAEAGSLLRAKNVRGDGSSDVVVLEDFSSPTHTWTEMNDPVMGGKSSGTFLVEGGVGHFQGEVVDVPFLHAPGFIQSRTTDHVAFPDMIHCKALQFVVRSRADYQGYRVSFGNAHAPGGKMFAYGYKANLELDGGDDVQTVTIPFHQFTDFWDDATGDPIHTCQEDERFCPDEYTLQNVKRLAVWGEGVVGKVDLEIQKIQAVGCDSGNA
jgi:hypothetical protein